MAKKPYKTKICKKYLIKSKKNYKNNNAHIKIQSNDGEKNEN